MNEVVLASGIGTGRTSVGFIAYIIIGGFAGWAASKFMGTAAQQGIILNIVVGVADTTGKPAAGEVTTMVTPSVCVPEDETIAIVPVQLAPTANPD